MKLALTLLATCVLGLVCCRAAGLSQADDIAVRVVAPSEGAYVSGPVTIRAEISPASALARVREITFWVDGEVVCRRATPPFTCDWDGGPRVDAHVIRAVATLDEGRLTHTVRTKKLDYSEVVDVDAVQVIAVVTDDAGRFVKGLPREAFRVFEDDRPQVISHFASENVPLELVTAIDISGSMKIAMALVKAAAKRFLSSLPPGHEVTVVAFNDNLFTLARRGTDPAVRARAVDRLAAWGSTALYDAILYGFELLGRQPGRRAMVVFTDGDDKVSHANVSAVVRRAESNDAALYMVGQGQAATSAPLQRLLTRLASLSGGRAFIDTGTERLEHVFDAILDDLSNQYLITYQPTDQTRDDRWRTIRVEVDRPGLHVRARQGYRREG